MALRLIATVRREGFEPDVVMSGAAIGACARAGRLVPPSEKRACRTEHGRTEQSEGERNGLE